MTGYTHGGIFHSDDVFAAALLELINSSIVIVRTNQVEDKILVPGDIIFDTGGKYDGVSLFDHHQSGGPVRENGLKYSSIGLLWKAFGNNLTKDESVWKQMDAFFGEIDAVDNGQWEGELPTGHVTRLVNLFVIPDMDDEMLYTQFRLAVMFAKNIIVSMLYKYTKVRTAVAEMESCILSQAEAMVITLPKPGPWADVVFERNIPALYVVYPDSLRGIGSCKPFPLPRRNGQSRENPYRRNGFQTTPRGVHLFTTPDSSPHSSRRRRRWQRRKPFCRWLLWWWGNFSSPTTLFYSIF
jgi:uncharacterized UPF0160 family protein